MSDKLNILQKKINIKFKDLNYLKKSITHKSFNAENNYEKLEFLGDRILGFVISKKLIELFPHEKEGLLDKKLASLVNKNKCFEIGKKLMLDEFILVGNTNKYSTKIENKIISDCCEAIIGAVYLDKGFEHTEKFILNIWNDLIKESNKMHIDAKTKLQEFSLKKFKKLPSYKTVSNTGPRHKPIIKVGVKLPNTKFYFAEGASKKDAEQKAAILCLNNNL